MESLFDKPHTENSIANRESYANNADTVETTIDDSLTSATFQRASLGTEDRSQSPGTLFVPFLGQSNAQYMSFIYDPYQPGSTENNTSGAIVLQQSLSDSLDSSIVTSDTPATNFAVGGSKVNGNGYYMDDEYVWWYPEEDRPGGALLQAQTELEQWLSDNQAQPNDEIAIVWSQGESDVGDIFAGNPDTKEAYKQSTIAVFDYLQDNLGWENITFYLVPTGRLQEEGAANAGLNSQEIDFMNQSLAVIREAQSEIALERNDVQLAPSYSDLNMVYEEGQIYGESYDRNYEQWSRDFWHLGHDGLKINGDRLAQYIALDRGANNVISFTDSFGDPAQSISLTRDGILDLNITASSSQEIIQGTDNPDLILGSLEADEITGGNGNDVIVGSQGADLLTGGGGSDVFFYADVANREHLITDFEIGNDRIDISEPLSQANYSGTDPVADGYVVVNSTGDNRLEIQFDGDGGGEQPASTFAILENVSPTEFQTDFSDRFIFTPTEF